MTLRSLLDAMQADIGSAKERQLRCHNSRTRAGALYQSTCGVPYDGMLEGSLDLPESTIEEGE